MDADGLPLVGPGVDYTKVESIHQKRTIAFINHFITHTASFLNRFSGVCEQKLENLSNKIQQLEISMSLLEAKLSSVPGLENVTVASTASTTTSTMAESSATPTATTAAPASSAPAAPQPPPSTEDAGAAAAEPAEESKPSMTVSQHPSYARFFKMVQFGVPSMAVKNKMIAEGLNPDFLDTPDAAAPDGGGSSGGGGGNKSDSDDFSDNNDDDDDDDDNDSDDDFSD